MTNKVPLALFAKVKGEIVNGQLKHSSHETTNHSLAKDWCSIGYVFEDYEKRLACPMWNIRLPSNKHREIVNQLLCEACKQFGFSYMDLSKERYTV